MQYLHFVKMNTPLFFITWQPRPISCDWLSSKIFNVRKLYFENKQKIILSFKRCSLTLFWIPRLKLFSKPVKLLLHFLVFLSGRQRSSYFGNFVSLISFLPGDLFEVWKYHLLGSKWVHHAGYPSNPTLMWWTSSCTTLALTSTKTTFIDLCLLIVPFIFCT